MSKNHLPLTFALGLAVATAGCGGSSWLSSSPGAPSTHQAMHSYVSRSLSKFGSPIQHVVIIVQENRSPDNLFHGLPGADIANAGLDSKGKTIPLRPVKLAARFTVVHTHKAWETQYDDGKMDGADLLPVHCKRPVCPKHAAFAYVKKHDVEPYMTMAQTYTFADRMFQTNEGPSFPAHQCLIAGTSQDHVGSNLLATDNPENPNGGGAGHAGCDAPAGTKVAMINDKGKEGPSLFPCFEHPTLMDLLDNARLPWRYYAPNTFSIWTGPNSISHIRFGLGWQNVIIPETKILNDIAANNLAPVTWVIPSGRASDHPSMSDGSGPSWVASIVNAIGKGPYWANTAIFVTWDDWGGWYDHVPPPARHNANEMGFRVPLIVISPYARPQYVSHVDHEFGSILHYVESNFGLPSLGYSDSRSDDLADCFNYSQTPLTFHKIKSSLPMEYFARGIPQTSPDDE